MGKENGSKSEISPQVRWEVVAGTLKGRSNGVDVGRRRLTRRVILKPQAKAEPPYRYIWGNNDLGMDYGYGVSD